MRDSVKYRFGDRRRCQVAVGLKTLHNVSNIHRFTYQTLPLGIFRLCLASNLVTNPTTDARKLLWSVAFRESARNQLSLDHRQRTVGPDHPFYVRETRG